MKIISRNYRVTKNLMRPLKSNMARHLFPYSNLSVVQSWKLVLLFKNRHLKYFTKFLFLLLYFYKLGWKFSIDSPYIRKLILVNASLNPNTWNILEVTYDTIWNLFCSQIAYSFVFDKNDVIVVKSMPSNFILWISIINNWNINYY